MAEFLCLWLFFLQTIFDFLTFLYHPKGIVVLSSNFKKPILPAISFCQDTGFKNCLYVAIYCYVFRAIREIYHFVLYMASCVLMSFCLVSSFY